MKPAVNNNFDRPFFLCAVFLILFGFVMVLNSSFIFASDRYADGYYFLKKHVAFAFIGFVFMMALSRYEYTKLQKWIFPLFIAIIVLLVLTLIPGIGVKVKGARRWLDFIFFRFQTSELAKYVVIMFLANYYKKHQNNADSLLKFIVIPMLMIFPILLLIYKQPNFSTLSLMAITIFAIIFVSGIRWHHLLYISTLGIASAAGLLALASYRMDRIYNYLNPWANPEGGGYQAIQALIAFSSGGFFGSGLGASKQALFIPEAHNDFIFAIIAEQLGFVGVIGVLALYFIFIYRGIRIAVRSTDLFGRIMVFGIMFMVCFQVLFNVGVVVGLLPVTGLPLPFLSYGGTAMISFMAFTGIVLNVSRSAVR